MGRLLIMKKHRKIVHEAWAAWARIVGRKDLAHRRRGGTSGRTCGSGRPFPGISDSLGLSFERG